MTAQTHVRMRNLLGCTVLAAACVASAAIDDFFAYYPFDGHDMDLSGNGYHLIQVQYDAAWFALGKGVVGAAASFSHADNYVRDTRRLDVNGIPPLANLGTTFTFSAWVKPSFVGETSQPAQLLSLWDSGDGHRIVNISYQWANDRIDVLVSSNGLQAVAGSSVNGPNPLYLDEADMWYHVAVVFDLDGTGGTDDYYFYVTPATSETVRVTSIDKPITNFHNYSGADNSTFVAFGSDSEGLSSQEFRASGAGADDGYLDEVALYSRALSQAEVQELFDRGKNGQSLTATTTAVPYDYAAYWQFDGNNDDTSTNQFHFDGGSGFATGKGVSGDCAQFSHTTTGTDTRHIEVNDIPPIRDIGPQWTMSTWIRPSTGSDWDAQVFCYANAGIGIRSVHIRWQYNVGRIDTSMTDDGAGWVGDSSRWWADDTNTWYHVAVVSDLDGLGGSADLITYVTPITAATVRATAEDVDINSYQHYSGPDGSMEFTVGSAPALPYTAQQYKRTDATSEDGRIDEMAFYSRVLSPQEIQALFDRGKGGEPLLPRGSLLIIQ